MTVPKESLVQLIGSRMRRREDPALLKGAGKFAGDHQPTSLLHMAVVRAAFAPARVIALDVSALAAMPGVVGAWSANDLGIARNIMPEGIVLPPGVEGRPILATTVARYAGEALAVLVAENEYQARDAAELSIAELEPITSNERRLPAIDFNFGDTSRAFAEAPLVIRGSFAMGKVCGAAIEPRAVIANWDDVEGTLTIHASIGWIYGLRDAIATCLDLAADRVVVLSEDVGGSFGAKNHPYPEYILASALARKLDRPVRWCATRIEDGLTTGQAHGALMELELASDSDGLIRGLRGRMLLDAGAYWNSSANQAYNYASHSVSAYRLGALHLEVQPVLSTAPPTAYIRGGGRPVGNFGIERLMDKLARHLKLEPSEVRRRNLIRPDEMPYSTGLPQQTYDGGDYPQLLELALNRIDLDAIRQRQGNGEPVGFGVAMCVESTGLGAAEPSRVRVLADGTVEVLTGNTPQGQGHATFITQIVADRLGWPADRIRIQMGDTRAVAFSQVTAGSRSALEVGNSVALSALAARRALLSRAAEILESDTVDLRLTIEGVAVVGVPSRTVALESIVGSDGLEVSETWNSNGAKAWASSCHAAVVRIDVATGVVEMLRYVIAHDSGRVINPLMLEGQLYGGYAHGLGYALYEHAAYSADGSFLSPSFLDYTIVSAPELRCLPELLHIETASSQNPEGFRGVGEAGTIAVPAAIANAVEDGLRSLGYDVAVDQVPITPWRLYEMLKADTSRSV